MLTADILTAAPGPPAVVKRETPRSVIVHSMVYVAGVNGAILASSVTLSPGEMSLGMSV